DIVHESDGVLAFRDTNPQAPTHILLIPKDHVPSVRDARAEHANRPAGLVEAAGPRARGQGVYRGRRRSRGNAGPASAWKGGARGASQVMTDRVRTGRGRSIGPRTLGQKRYVAAIRASTVRSAIGPPGPGNTYLAVATAVKALQDQQVRRIILSRPAVEAG